MKLHLPLKLRAALLALCLTGAPSAFSFYDTIFKFEGSTASETASETGSKLYEVAGTTVSGTETYIDSGLVVGYAIGNYKLTRDLGKAFSFSDGSYIKLTDTYWSDGDGKLFPGSSFTIATYVNFDNVLGGGEQEQFLFGTGNDASKGFVFGVQNGILDYLRKYVAHDKPASQSVTMCSRTWYALAVSYDSSKHLASFYIDGKLVGTATVADAFNDATGNAAIGAGSANGQRPFTGAMAELQILSGAKTQTEIMALFGLTTVKDLWWRGTATENAWDTSSKRWVLDQDVTVADTKFTQGERVHFGTEGGTVTIDENIVAHEMIVAGTYSFNVGADKKLTTGALTISDGATATLGGSGFTSITGNVDSEGDNKSGILKIDGGTVTVTGAINSALEVTGGELTANLITSTAVIKSGSLTVTTVAASGNLTVSGGTTTITGGNKAFSGSMLLVSGGTVEFIYNHDNQTSCISSGATINVTEGGTLKLTGHDMLGWGKGVSPEEIILEGKTGIGNQAILDIEDTGSCTFTPTIVMNGYSELTGTKFNSFGNTKTENGVTSVTNNCIEASGVDNIISIQFDVRREARLNVAENGKLTISGIIANGVGGEGQLVKTGTGTLIVTSVSTKTQDFSRGTRVEEGTLRLQDGGTLGSGVISLAGGTTLELTGNTELANTITGVEKDNTTTWGSIVVTGAGRSVLSGNVNATPITVKNGATLGLTSTFTSSGSIEFESGARYKGVTATGISSLTVGNTLTIVSSSWLTSDATPTYKDKGAAATDGYAVATYRLATVATGGSISLPTGAQAVLGGTGYVLAANGGSLTFTTDGTSGDFYINTENETVSYNTGDTSTSDIASNATSTVVLNASGVTLNMQTSLNPAAIGGIRAMENATVRLQKDITLKRSDVSVDSGKTLTLTGSGYYDLASESNTGVTLASGESGWTGTVVISDTNLGGPINWNAYVNGTFSTLKLTSVSGWINPNSTVAANLRLLEDTDGAPGFTITGVNNNVSYSFSGKISGNGDLAMKQADRADRSATFNLQGDCSEWTGNFLLSEMGSGTATVNYTGSPAIGNGFINDSAATMNVNLSKDGDAVVVKGIIDRKGEGDLNLSLTGSSSKSFKKSVNATSITVGGGAAVFSGKVTTTTLTANADTSLEATGNVIGSVAGTGKMIVSGGSTEVTNAPVSGASVEVTGGTLTLSNGTAAGGGSVTVKYGGTLSLKAGTTNFAADTVTLETGSVLTCNGNAELTGTVGGSGTLKVAKDTSLTISGSVTLGATIENAGTLNLNTDDGSKLSFISRDILTRPEGNDKTYYDSKAASTGNGYSYGSYVIIDQTGGGELGKGSIITSVHLVNEDLDSPVSLSSGGNITITDKVADAKGGLYYIRYNTVDTDHNDENGKEAFVYSTKEDTDSSSLAKTTGLVLDKADDEAKPLTLVMTTDLNTAAKEGIIVRSNATIQLNDGVSLNKATIDPTKNDAGTVTFTPTLKLTGTGKYVMDHATKLDVEQTQFDTTGWQGTVVVTDTELGGNGDDKFHITALNNLVSYTTEEKDGSTQQVLAPLEISGLSGYAYDTKDKTNPTVTANLALTGTALTLTNGPEAAGTLTFSGKLSGEGAIVNNSTGDVKLSGGISDWKGSYTASNKSTSLVFAGTNAQELNASVEGGSLKVEKDVELTVKSNLSLDKEITNAGTLTFGTDGSLSFKSLDDLKTDGEITYTDGTSTGNGYKTGSFYIVKGGTTKDLTEVKVGNTTFTTDDHNLEVSGNKVVIKSIGQPGLYYIWNDSVDYGNTANPNSAASDGTTGLVLKGGTLNMYSSLNKNATEGIVVDGDATICLCEGGSLEDVALTVEKKDGVQLTLLRNDGKSVLLGQLTGDGTLAGGSNVLVKESGSFTGTYSGTVRVGTSDQSAIQELRADENLTVIGTAGTVKLTGLNNTGASLNKLGGIDTKDTTVLLNNESTDGTTPTKVTLGSASTMVGGVLDFTVSAKDVNANLAADKAAKPTVTTGAALSLTDVTLKVHEVENENLDFNTSGKEKDILLFVLNDTQDGCSVTGDTKVDMSECTWMTKYFTNFRVVQGSVNVVGDANTGYYAVHGQTGNGTAGLSLAGKAMFNLDPQKKAPNGELAQVLNMLDAHIESGNKGAMDKLGAALAGSSLSAVGMAVSDDVQRQLRAIRNRTTTMGVNECVVNEDMPYVNGWISGDGNYRQLSESGTDAGYQLSSWGGTVGVDVDVNPNLTLGVAVSALFGDYTGKAADTLTGDLDTQYVSLFARVSTGSWVNTFVGTLGRADVDLERTIPGVTGKTTYKTNGMMFGFLYEVARTFSLNEDASTCVQPLFNMSFSHTSLDSATEGGTADTRLTTDSASLTQFSLGLGGRIQSVVGENEYNRASIFEARALLKLDLGDRYSKLNTALAALPTATVSTRSNEKGVIGAEVGASLTIPISQDAGSIFFDVNADFNADQTGVNGSVGYRINF